MHENSILLHRINRIGFRTDITVNCSSELGLKCIIQKTEGSNLKHIKNCFVLHFINFLSIFQVVGKRKIVRMRDMGLWGECIPWGGGSF